MIRSIATILFLFPIFILQTVTATIIKTVGSSGDNYTTISAAYSSCTGAFDYVIRIQSDYDYNAETSTGINNIVLGQLTNKSAVNTVTILPKIGATLSFSGTASSIFYLNGADYVVFDGRANGVGSSAWTLINSSSASSKRIFTFLNSATFNTVRYLTIKGDNSSQVSSDAGLLFFSMTASSGVGNLKNTIDHCTIRENNAFPACHLNFYGYNSLYTDSTVISNCNLINCSFRSIWEGSQTDNIEIKGNNFYQSMSQTLQNDITFIHLENGKTYLIEDNYFGGQSPLCSGNAFTLLDSPYSLKCIYAKNIQNGTLIIRGNNFQNFDITSSSDDASIYSSVGFSAILIENGTRSKCIIGQSDKPNKIGSTTGTDNILLTLNSTSATQVKLIFSSASGSINHVISYNNIGGISIGGTTSMLTLRSIFIRNLTSSTGAEITHNIIGNATPNNIKCSVPIIFSGIENDNYFAYRITNNTIQNTFFSTSFSLHFTGIKANFLPNHIGPDEIAENTIGSTNSESINLLGTGRFNGIIYYSDDGIQASIHHNTIQNVRISNLSNVESHYGIQCAYGNSTVISKNLITKCDCTSNLTAIYCTNGSNFIISQNEILDLAGINNSNNSSQIKGIYSDAGIIYKNKVAGLSNLSTNSSSAVRGIQINSSLPATIFNNVVLIGHEPISFVASVYGIDLLNSAANCYHNSVSIGGTTTSGKSYALYSTLSSSSGNVQNIYNNVFHNVRIGSSTHYTETYTGIGGTIVSDFNYLENAPSQSANTGKWNNVNRSFATFKTASGATNSKNSSIIIDNLTGKVATVSYNDIQNTGTNAYYNIVPDDFEGNGRSNAGIGMPNGPWIGAFEDAAILLPVGLISFTAVSLEKVVLLEWMTSSEINNDYFTIEKSLDGIHFEKLAIVKALGNSVVEYQYQFRDGQPYNGISYYQLSQTDIDGKIEKIALASVKRKSTMSSTLIIPNPNQGNTFRILLHPSLAADTIEKIEIENQFGQKIECSIEIENSEIVFIRPSYPLAIGFYYITVKHGERLETVRFVVE